MTTRFTPDSPSLLLPVLAVLLGLCAFSGMDAVMKTLSLEMGAFNAVFWRYMVGAGIASLLYFSKRRVRPSVRLLRLYCIRGIVTAFMAFSFFWGLTRIPLAEGVALSFIAPLIALYLAALLLHERVGRNAIFASLLGMAGVIVIVLGKMEGEFDADSQWGVAAILFSATLYAWNLILQRQQSMVAGPIEIVFFQNIIVFALFLCVAPFLAEIPGTGQWPSLFGAAVLAIFSLFIISWAYARAEAQHLVSLEYSAFIWALGFGWYFFGEIVSWTTVAGAVLIVSGCLLVAWRRPKKAEIVEAAVA